MSSPSRDRDPLAPVEFVIKVLLTFVLVISALVGGVMAWELTTTGTTQASFGSLGGGDLCVEDVVTVPMGGSGSETDRRFFGITGFDREAGRYRERSWEVCLFRPTVGQRIAVGAGDLLAMASVVGSMALLLSAVRRARKTGLFTTATAGRTRLLGWFLLVTGVATPLLQAGSQGWVLSSLVDDYDWWRPVEALPFSTSVSWVTLVVAVGIITVARVLERAVPLQEEVDATV